MRTLRYLSLVAVMCVISSCLSSEMLPYLHDNPGEEMSPDIELRGQHYATLNSIGCFQYNDLQITKTAGFDTIDNLIKAKRCFVIPAGTDILIQERIEGDVVSVKLKGTTQTFYTVRSNLIRQ